MSLKKLVYLDHASIPTYEKYSVHRQLSGILVFRQALQNLPGGCTDSLPVGFSVVNGIEGHLDKGQSTVVFWALLLPSND